MKQSSDVDMNVQSAETQDEKEPLLRNANNRGGAFAVIIILILTFFQYVAYFSVVKNMVGYWHEHLKSTMDNAWLERVLLVGIGQCAALFGGIIADVLLGKRKTLGVGFTFYLLGAMMLEISTVDSQKTSKKSLATASVAFVVLAEACVSPTLAILGATQLTVNEYNCELVMLMFYLLRNCGALLVNYLVTFVFGPAGDGQFWPALAATLAALLLYLVGLRRYKIEKKIEGIGVACAVISAFFAINMETARKADFKDHNGNASLSVFILLPQYALVGAGEIMTLVSGMEMAFLGAPRGLRCTALGLFWTATGLGYFAAFGVLAFVNKYEKDWISFEDVQQLKHLGRADYYLLLLMALLTICFIFFLLTARYVNKTVRKRSIDANARKKLERVSIQEASSSQNPPGNSSGTNLCQQQENDGTDRNVESSDSSVKTETDGEATTKTVSSEMPVSEPSY